MIKEDFLHFVWKLGYFDQESLTTTDHKPLQILKPGEHNRDSGPDFDLARLQIGDVLWVGKVELHLHSSDWDAHGHQHDPAYENVILHVVWEHNREIYYPDGRPLPTLVLKNRVEPSLAERYEFLQHQHVSIPCQSLIASVPSIKKQGMLSRALLERLHRKSEAIRQMWENTGENWEETTYQLLAKSFGHKVNDASFLALAKALPLKLLRKHAHQRLQLEALLFGQAGLLEEKPFDDYQTTLQREYRFLAHKYGLASKQLTVVMWQFAKLRPSGFPTLGIARMAALLQKNPSLFSALIHTEQLEAYGQFFKAELSAYWQHHYRFGKISKTPVANTARQAHFLINTVAPLLNAYEQYKPGGGFQEKALRLLESLKPENHRITRKWKALGWKFKGADETQAALELHQQYCEKRRCLSCHIGAAILSKSVRKTALEM